MASDDYDKLVLAIDAMEKILETDSLVLYKEQCKQMVRDFMHVRDVLDERKDMKTNSKFSAILKELYRQTFAASAVLESCWCCVEVTQEDMTVIYSWLQVAVTQDDKFVFKVIRDDLEWWLGLVSRVENHSVITEEEPRYYRYSTKLAKIDRKLMTDTDETHFKRKLEDFLSPGPHAGTAQEPDKLLATFLLARHNNANDENHVLFANRCESNIVWSKKENENYLGQSTTTSVAAIDWLGVRLARKVFRDQQPDEDCLAERKIMAPLNHPNVVRFISCSDQGGDPAILLECVETSLHKYLQLRVKEYIDQPSGWVGKVVSRAGLNTLEVVDIMYQIAFVMAYLHENGVAHCDIKPSNLLVNPCRVPGFEGYVQLKIADFNISKSGLNADGLRDSSRENRGTTIYRAPELIGRAKNVDFKKADMFSYALTCWHILYGKDPFEGMSRCTLHHELLSGTRPVIELDVPITLANLIRKCWRTTPQDRPTFTKVCLDLQTLKEELLLGVVPFELISVPEIKTKRMWKVFQSSYKTVRTLVVRILPPQSSSIPEQEEPEEEETILAPSCTFFRQLGDCGCFSRPTSSEDYIPEYPGPPDSC